MAKNNKRSNVRISALRWIALGVLLTPSVAVPQLPFMGIPLGSDAYSMVEPLTRKGLKFEGLVGGEALSFSGIFAGWYTDYLYVRFSPDVEAMAYEALVGFESGEEPDGWEPMSKTVFSDLRSMLYEKYSPALINGDSTLVVVKLETGSINLRVTDKVCTISYLDSVGYAHFRRYERTRNLNDL